MTTSRDAALLRLEGVGKTFHHKGEPLQVLHDVDLEVARGEFVALLGPSGSGKSTLLSLMGLMDAPSTGRVLHRGRSLAEVPERERALERLHTIGFIFQHFYLVPTLTAEENVVVPMKAAGLSRSEREARLDHLFAGVGLEARRKHYPHELSGGEQQRVAVARALANNPALLLADEPTGELDPEASARVMDLLLWANRDLGCAVVLVTHQEATVPAHARRLRMAEGRVVAEDPKARAARRGS